MNQVLFRVILIMCTVLTGLSDLRETTVAARDSSSWYWQNPLPRSFSMNEIACPSAIECVTVGQEGSIMLTTDAGQHWASGDSGTTADLSYVACSGSSVCYALGSTDDGNALDLLLRSTDGGTAWSDVSQQLQIGEGQGDRPSFVCPSSTTCLLMSTIAGTAVHVYRTTDGGRHWKAVPRGPTSPAGGPITCVTTRICYAGSGHAVFRTADAGASWSEEAALPGPYLESLACPRANTCVASSGGHIYLTRNGGSTWRDVNRRAADVRTLVCGSPRLCYGIGFNSVVRTLDGGKSWESHAAPLFESIDQVVCPTGTRCFAAAGFTALETSDGFAHVRQAPASSAFGGTYLYSLSCPLPTTCYGRSYAYSLPNGSCRVSTTDGGARWRGDACRRGVAPPPLMIRCPTVNACYGYGLIYPVEDVDNNHPPEAFLYRSSDAARSWNRSRIPGKSVTEDYPGSFTCVSVLICYTVAVKDGLTFLVTADGGARWTAKRSIARIIDGSSSPFGGSLSCPDVTTCFVVVHGPPTVQYTRTFTILQTTNAGDSWTAWSSVPCASDCENDIALACPTDTTCYVVPMDESLGPLGPGTAAVTHDGGVTWHTAEVSDRGSLTRIACPNSQTCVIVGSAGIYGTDDGGSTWQEQTVAGGRSPTGLNDIGCPAVNTCYAVGGAVILATHPAAGSSSDRWPGG